MEDAIAEHLRYVDEYVRSKYAYAGRRDLSDFSEMRYQDPETVADSLQRNAVQILNLALLSLLGFAGTFVVLLRYDVR